MPVGRKYLVPVDLSRNELQNAVIQVLGSAPGDPVEGQIYYNSSTHKAYIYNGSAWKALDEYVALDYAETDDMVASAPGDTVSAGTSSEVSRGDHRHARESFASTASTQAIGDSAAAGSGSDVSRGDHKHAMPGFGNVSAETSFGGSSGNGTATSVSHSDHTHGTPAHDGTAHSSISLSSLSAPTGNLAIGGYKLTGVADPVDATDAATRGYVDGLVQGLSWKDAARVATTGNVTLATGLENGDTIDGVVLATGDRVLVLAQDDAEENGLYVVKASGAPDRAPDANTAAEISGMAVFITEGTANGGKQYVLTTDLPITLDTTELTFTQFGGQTTYTWGDGLTETTGTVAVNTGTSSSTGLKIESDTVQVDFAYVPHYKVFTITGNGSADYFDLTHSFGNQYVSVQVIEDSTNNQVEPDIVRSSTTVCRITFATPPANDKVYKAIVVG